MTNLKKNNGIWLDKMELPKLFRVAKSKESLKTSKISGRMLHIFIRPLLACVWGAVFTRQLSYLTPGGSYL